MGCPSHAGTGLAHTHAHSAVVMSGCVLTGSPGMLSLYYRKVRAARSLASAAACSRSKVRRKCGLTAATGFTRSTSSKSVHNSGSAYNTETCRPSELPAATNAGHHDAGPVNGAGASVPTATTIVRRFPSAVVIASHSRRPIVGPHAPGSSVITIRTFAQSPSARRESLEITLTRVRVSTWIAPSLLQR